MNAPPLPPVTAAGGAQAAAGRKVVALRFTASGSEYFRIWSVNALLILVTLGLYLPFAKARRLRYFHANTLVDGDALAFHGDPWKMFRGYVVMLLLFGAYAGASYISEPAALGAFAIASLAWPALWRSSLMFRMANTSWRGLRFAFEGSTGGAYRAQALLFLPAFVGLLGTALATSGIAPGDDAAAARAAAMVATTGGVAFVVAIFAVPLGLAWVKRYQHGGLRYAGESARLTSSTAAFYGLGLKLLLAGLGVLVGLVVLAYVGWFVGKVAGVNGRQAGAFALLGGLWAFFAYLAAFALLSAWAAAWLQNLVWNGTESQTVRFASSLRPDALAWLSIRNLALVVLTLGLYRPFAVVRVMRMRLEAVSVSLPVDAQAWAASASPRPGSARGEMAGDFFGIDVGL